MALALHMDHHVPYAITYCLRADGIDVVTTEEDGG